MAVAAAAPLLAGGVHRGTLALIMATLGLAVTFWLVGTTIEGRPLRLSRLAILPALFVLIPALQSIPLPVAVRRLVDPRGTRILLDASVVRQSVWPLSLDPPAPGSTSGGRRCPGRLPDRLPPRLRPPPPGAAHACDRADRDRGGRDRRRPQIFGDRRIYGMFASTPRTLLVGPFVNANHTAELLELAAFACLACSFQRRTALNRVGWLIGMVLCAGGMAATLSRGGDRGGRHGAAALRRGATL